MKQNKGFSLIELMIVVTVIGILSAIAVPAYSDYVTRGMIPDATSALARDRVQLEQFFQDNRRYSIAIGDATCGGSRPPARNFDLVCVATDSTFAVTATGKSGTKMAGFSYTINESNAKTSTTPWGNSASCWVTKKDGSC